MTVSAFANTPNHSTGITFASGHFAFDLQEDHMNYGRIGYQLVHADVVFPPEPLREQFAWS